MELGTSLYNADYVNVVVTISSRSLTKLIRNIYYLPYIICVYVYARVIVSNICVIKWHMTIMSYMSFSLSINTLGLLGDVIKSRGPLITSSIFIITYYV